MCSDGSASSAPLLIPPGVALMPDDFPERLERFKEATGFTWDGLAGCLGVDPRQLQRWRKDTKPDGDGLCALITLAACVPGGLYILVGIYVGLPPVGALQPPLVVGFGRDGREG